MPNYFSLTPIGLHAPGNTPDNLCDVDEALAKYLNVPVHPTKWCVAWYDIEGFGFALGCTWNELRSDYPNRRHIIDWFEANYTVKSWYQPR